MDVRKLDRIIETFSNTDSDAVRGYADLWDTELKVHHVAKLFTEIAKLSGLDSRVVEMALDSDNIPDLMGNFIDAALTKIAEYQVAHEIDYRMAS